MDRKPTRCAGVVLAGLLAAATAFAQAPSVTSTGSNAGKTPSLAAPGSASGNANATSSATATPPPGIPAQSGSVLPPMNATGLATPQVPPPSAANGVLTRSDSASTAFRSLDPSGRGYVTRAETDRIPGFVGFDNADTNRDGQLTQEEFNNAWKFFAGQ